MKNCIVSVLLYISHKNKIRPEKKKKERENLGFLLIEEKKRRNKARKSGTKWIIVYQETLFEKHLFITDYRQLRFMYYLVEPAFLNAMKAKREITLC